MIPLHAIMTVFKAPSRAMFGAIVMVSIVSTGCTTNYLNNSTKGTYGVPVTERTIPQRLLDRSIEHTAKINAYNLQESLQANSRMSIDSFYSEVLLSGEVPSDAIKTQIEQVVRSMPDVRRVYNEMNVGVARGYSSTVQDGYITSKLLAKAVTSDGIKSSQIKVVTNNGIVYVMGRMTPTQQSHLIDMANTTAGVTELVLFTTLVNDRGAAISDADIMSESNATDSTTTQAAAPLPIVRNTASTNTSNNTAIPVVESSQPTQQETTSPYIELYQNP